MFRKPRLRLTLCRHTLENSVEIWTSTGWCCSLRMSSQQILTLTFVQEELLIISFWVGLLGCHMALFMRLHRDIERCSRATPKPTFSTSRWALTHLKAGMLQSYSGMIVPSLKKRRQLTWAYLLRLSQSGLLCTALCKNIVCGEGTKAWCDTCEAARICVNGSWTTTSCSWGVGLYSDMKRKTHSWYSTSWRPSVKMSCRAQSVMVQPCSASFSILLCTCSHRVVMHLQRPA